MDETTFVALVDGRLSEQEGMAFLLSLRDIPITGPMLTFAAKCMRERMSFIEVLPPLLDTCGTGGDQQATLNISTAAAFVLAAAGVRVAKHGNRAVSSTSGSSDVLQALGVAVDQPADVVSHCIEKTNLGFCFAPRFHPRLRSLASLRKQLGIPTIFNYLGPLCNPARVDYQLLGVGRVQMIRPMAEALLSLGVDRAVVVHGDPGLDEVSLQGQTLAQIIENDAVREERWTASDFGLTPSTVDQLRCCNASDSARQLLDIFQGGMSAGRNWVIANAAVGLWVTRRAKTLQEGVQQADEVLRSGQVLGVLQKLQQLCPV